MADASFDSTNGTKDLALGSTASREAGAEGPISPRA
jgi:hypothetical protein